MTDELEEALKGTLRTASLDAPVVAPDLLDRLADRHRARRRGRVLSIAATVTAVGVVIGGTTLIPRPGGGQEPLTRPTSAPTAAPTDPVPIPKAAVRTVRDTLPSGREYLPQVALSPTSFLVSTESSFEVTDALWVYDVGTGKAAKVTDVRKPTGSIFLASGFAVGDGQVAWRLTREDRGRRVTEIWAAPLAGGAARMVIALDAGSDAGRSAEQLVVGGGKIRWSLSWDSPDADEGVYEAPLTGGRARMVPGSEGRRILAWPWAGAPGSTSWKAGEVANEKLRDLETGQARDADLPKGKSTWACTVTWCMGRPAGGRTGRNTAQGSQVLRRDGGAGRSTTPGLQLDFPVPVLYDRFLPQYVQTKKHGRYSVLYDLASGKLLDLGLRDSGAGVGSIPVAWQGGSAPMLDRYAVSHLQGSIQIVDLAAIR